MLPVKHLSLRMFLSTTVKGKRLWEKLTVISACAKTIYEQILKTERVREKKRQRDRARVREKDTDRERERERVLRWKLFKIICALINTSYFLSHFHCTE